MTKRDWFKCPPDRVRVEVYKWSHDSYGNPTAKYSIFWNNGEIGEAWQGGHWHSKRREQVGYQDKISEAALARLPVLFPGTCWTLEPETIKGGRSEHGAEFYAHRDYDAEPIKFHLQRIKLNSAGYTSGGVYYGAGAPLWYAASEDGKHESYVRGVDRESAKAAVRVYFPTARFFR